MTTKLRLAWLLAGVLAWMPVHREAGAQMVDALMVASLMPEVVASDFAGVLLARVQGEESTPAGRGHDRSATRMRCDAAGEGRVDDEGTHAGQSIVPPRSECADPPSPEEVRELRRWRDLAPGEDPQRRPLPLVMFLAPLLTRRTGKCGKADGLRAPRFVHRFRPHWLLLAGSLLVTVRIHGVLLESVLRLIAVSL